MELDRNNKNKTYLLGRAAAIIENLSAVSKMFVTLAHMEPKKKMSEWFDKASIIGNTELSELVSTIGEIPLAIEKEGDEFWPGYFAQKDELTESLIQKQIGKQLHDIRIKKGINVSYLSSIYNFPNEDIYKMEAGRGNFDIELLDKLCKALGAEIQIVKKA